MYEFLIAKKYLWPKRKKVSVSLIGLLSVFVISLVIWLLLLFLSITEGIEKNWLEKVTSLNAPVRILPTEEYFNSYYYQVDGISSKSEYRLKSIHEKLNSEESDPYCEEVDEEVPFYWARKISDPQGNTRDLVKDAFSAISLAKTELNIPLSAEDYEVAGALMRLRQVRKGDQFGSGQGDSQNFLTQAAYIASITKSNSSLTDLIEKPILEDINHLLYIADRVSDNQETSDKPLLSLYTKKLANDSMMKGILSNLLIKKVETGSSSWHVNHTLLQDHVEYEGYARIHGDQVICVVLPVESDTMYLKDLCKGVVVKAYDQFNFIVDGKKYNIDPLIPIFLDQEITFNTTKEKIVIPENMRSLKDCMLHVEGSVQNRPLKGKISWENLKIKEAEILQNFTETPAHLPPWVSFVNGTVCLPQDGVVLPNNFRDYKVLIGDSGYFAFGSATPTSMQEQRLPTKIAGFYDPGVMSVGARFALGDRDIARSINETSQNTPLDPMLSNGIQVWFKDLKKTPVIAAEINKQFNELGLSPYWKVVPFYQYEFAKDLMTQFQSDRYLFMIIGVIILFVACSNIISLLLLMVNDKKHEIGVLLSLGSKKRSIALIFALCGITMGAISCLIGSVAAFYTLKNIDSLVHFLNFLEGQQAFNAAFYGNSLPNVLSKSSLIFILIATPIVSMLAGLIPAFKACKLKPSAILRSE